MNMIVMVIMTMMCVCVCVRKEKERERGKMRVLMRDSRMGANPRTGPSQSSTGECSSSNTILPKEQQRTHIGSSMTLHNPLPVFPRVDGRVLWLTTDSSRVQDDIGSL